MEVVISHNTMSNCSKNLYQNIFSRHNQYCRSLYVIFLLSLTVCGLSIFFFGYWLKTTLNNLSDISTYLAFTVPVSITVLGVFITIQGLVGFMCINHPTWILLYGYSLLFFFALEFFICLSVYYYSPDVNESLSNELKSFMQTYHPNAKCCNMMDEIQKKFQCCGIDQPTDWLNTKFGKIPESCCKNTNSCNVDEKQQLYDEGCRMNIKSLITEKKVLLEALLFPAAFIPFIGMLITFYYGNQLTRQQYEQIE